MYDVDGVALTAVSREGLLEMKKIAGRPQDLSDIQSLESIDGGSDST